MKLSTTNTFLCFFLWAGSSAFSQETNKDNGEHRDLLHFLNGDYLHGSYAGMQEAKKVQWQHPDITDLVEVDTNKIRRIALHHKDRSPDHIPSSYIQLRNGDQIPGEILALDDESVRMSTSFAKELSVPRDQIARLCPSPHGGRLFYYGPFSIERWTILNGHPKSPEPEIAPLHVGPAKEEEPQEKSLKEKEWVFSGAAWYNNDDTPISLAADMPDQAVISFNLAWKNRLNATVAFHATLQAPEMEDQKEGEKKKAQLGHLATKNRYPILYGESYVLSIISSYAQLHRCSFDEDGNPSVVALDSTNFNVRLEETGESNFELRCDREKSQIALYVNGRFITQWTDRDGYAGTGSQLAFASSAPKARLRISEIVVSSWNGMVDSALSMESKDRDVILLTNGTDRFSGKVASVEDQSLTVNGTFAEFNIPLSDVQEVRFASESGSEIAPPDSPSGQAVRLLLYPVGRITVVPTRSSSNAIDCLFMGHSDLSVDLKLIDVVEFSFGKSALDSWSEEF